MLGFYFSDKSKKNYSEYGLFSYLRMYFKFIPKRYAIHISMI